MELITVTDLAAIGNVESTNGSVSGCPSERLATLCLLIIKMSKDVRPTQCRYLS